MDKQEKISELFRFAREQEPKTSFEQTKDHFLDALKNQTVKTKNGRMSNLKKWIIMLSSMITIVGLSIMFLNQDGVTTQENKNSDNQFDNKNENKKRNQSSDMIPNNLQIDGMNQVSSNAINNLDVMISQENKLFNFDDLYFNTFSDKYQGIPFDDTLKTKGVEIPKLTPKEIKEVLKQKNLMLKLLSKQDDKKYAYFPSGTIPFEGNKKSIQAFFIQKTEVTNLEYRTFLYDLLIQDRKEEYMKAKPDEEMWIKCFSDLQKVMAKTYFTHPSYDNYPVVNITKAGAEMYCRWLLDEVIKKYPKNDFKYLLPRIPIRAEWVYAASSRGKNMVYPWGTDSTRNEEGSYLCNYKPFPNSFHDDGGFHSVIVTSYQPNEWGLYNMSGNVSEFVYNLDYSLAKPYDSKVLGTAGGGWLNNAEEIKIIAKDNHPGIVDPHPNVGFRIVFTHLGR